MLRLTPVWQGNSNVDIVAESVHRENDEDDTA